MAVPGRVPSSFRDPSGYLFVRDGTIYRQISHAYKDHYDRLIESGLYDRLVKERLLVAHDTVDNELAPSDAYKVIQPEFVPFISHPHEWCFSELKDAALTTLAIQNLALDHGMTLKDSSAYNVQFVGRRPILIDTLSFERYEEGDPWVAYRQFCQHFVAPLALMTYRDVRLGQLFRVYIDGVPLDLASSLLPYRSKLKPGLLTHIHLHAKAQTRYAGKSIESDRRRISRASMLGLISNLEGTVNGLRWQLPKTEWGEYYEDTNYSKTAMDHKRSIVAGYLDGIKPAMVWDLGANTGEFSRLAAERGILTIAFDVDPVAVEKNYLDTRNDGASNILPLVIDLTNPSPAMGWGNQERESFGQRGPADTVLALALVHHLAISNNVPFDLIARFFVSICRSLIIEFVPKSDSQVERLLKTRKDIFDNYTRESFESAFGGHFTIERATPVKESDRVLYWMNVKV